MAEAKKKGSMLKTLLKMVVFVSLLFVFVILGVTVFVLDGKYVVERSTIINASPEDVHKQVGDLRQWPNWLPFTKHDKTVKTTIEKPTGVGAHQHWEQDGMLGSKHTGKLTFTSDDEDRGIEYDMVFDEEYRSKGSFIYEKSGDGTKVTWRMTGQNDGFFGKWMASMMSNMAGDAFDEGLADLKKKVEEKK